MSDNRDVAAGLLTEALDTITKKRPGVHGSAEQSFTMIAELWTTHILHIRKTRNPAVEFRLEAQDVAVMMTMLKFARAVYGDVTNRDNFVDALGYTALAGMLQLQDTGNSWNFVGEQKPEADAYVRGDAPMEEMNKAMASLNIAPGRASHEQELLPNGDQILRFINRDGMPVVIKVVR